MVRNCGLGVALLTAASLASPAAWAQNPAPRARSAGTIIIQKGGTYLGVGVVDVDPERAKVLKLKEDNGAEVSNVAPDGPAAKAGIKEGYVVLEYNGQQVQGIAQFQRMVRETPAGRQVKVTVWRNGAPLNLMATVEARKEMVIETPSGDWGNFGSVPMGQLPPMANIDIPHIFTTMQSGMLGIEGEALGQQPQFADYFGVKDGVLVKAVTRNSAADKAGIKAGDVIVKVGDTHVGSSREITGALRTYRPKRTFTVTVVRNKKETPMTVTFDDQTGYYAPDISVHC